MANTPQDPVNLFLSGARSMAQAPEIEMLVFGNDAADLDSVASAIGLAWVLGAGKKDGGAVPLIPIHRDNFRLKTESRWALSQAGIDAERLLFLDDLQPLDHFISRVRGIALVDHNRLAGRFSNHREKVRHILDHHTDHHADVPLYPAALRRIEPVGSCATLVTEALVDETGRAGTARQIPGSLAALLLGAILVDTINLDPGAGRATPRDHVAATHLLPIAGLSAERFYQGLCAAKSDISQMDTQDLLRRDCKSFHFNKIRCIVASVPLALEQWMVRDQALASGIEAYAGHMQADLVITMNTWHTPEFSRTMTLFCNSPARFKTIREMLASHLDLERLPPPRGFDCGRAHFFRQGNPDISRKKLEPLLSRLFTHTSNVIYPLS